MSSQVTSQSSTRGTHEGDLLEQEARIKLAACYRIVDRLGWSEEIFNHITLRVPGEDDQLLVNGFGLRYDEVTASNLVKIDLNGNVIGNNEWPVNRAGIVIHTAIHSARKDVSCVIHVHTVAGSAVAGLREGLDRNNFYSSAIHESVAYHDFEGITVDYGEQERLVSSLGDKNLMILRNHGLIACGDSVPAAFQRMYLLVRACQVQVATMSMGRELQQISEEAMIRSRTAGSKMIEGSSERGGLAEILFSALQRKIDSIDPSYKL